MSKYFKFLIGFVQIISNLDKISIISLYDNKNFRVKMDLLEFCRYKETPLGYYI